MTTTTTTLQDHELARRENGGVLSVREAPMRLRWSLEELTSSDGHRLQCGFSCSIRALVSPTERRMLEEAFLTGRSSAGSAEVRGHFVKALLVAAQEAIAKESVEVWLDPASHSRLAETLRKAGDRIAFSCGLEWLPPFEIDLVSPSFQQLKSESLQRELTQKRRAGQLADFQRATELLRQFESLRTTMPQLSPGAILGQINTPDRAEMFQTLLMASSGQFPATLWAVAGECLLKIDPKSPTARPAMREVAQLGAFRSVQSVELSSRKLLCIGARGGLMLVDPQATQSAPRLFVDDQTATSALGFSRAVSWHDELWGCHGEGGVVGWSTGSDVPSIRVRLSPAQLGGAPKFLLVDNDSRLLCAVGSRVIGIDPSGSFSTAADIGGEIVALLAHGDSIIAVQLDGEVQKFARNSRMEFQTRQIVGAEACAASLMPWLGSARLLVASAHGPVYCLGLDDDLVTQYHSPHRGLRMLCASECCISGVSSDRQRLILWNSWDGKSPAAEINVAAVARHRIADVEFA